VAARPNERRIDDASCRRARVTTTTSDSPGSTWLDPTRTLRELAIQWVRAFNEQRCAGAARGWLSSANPVSVFDEDHRAVFVDLARVSK
jgi:hypothetical protein